MADFEFSDLLKKLGPKQQRGSKPKCHLLTHGGVNQVSERLSKLIAPWATVTADDRWMPQGFDNLTEVELHKAPDFLLESDKTKALGAWWLSAGLQRARTPNWDIVSSCQIEGKNGLLLVEAKAHRDELLGEMGGKSLSKDASRDSQNNHERIGQCIDEASKSLTLVTNLPWSLSRDDHYQMANRFAWAWKLTQLGLPVVLLYLGFLQSDDMAPREIFLTKSSWEEAVRQHSAGLFPGVVWSRRWVIHGQSFIPLIASTKQSL